MLSQKSCSSAPRDGSDALIPVEPKRQLPGALCTITPLSHRKQWQVEKQNNDNMSQHFTNVPSSIGQNAAPDLSPTQFMEQQNWRQPLQVTRKGLSRSVFSEVDGVNQIVQTHDKLWKLVQKITFAEKIHGAKSSCCGTCLCSGHLGSTLRALLNHHQIKQQQKNSRRCPPPWLTVINCSLAGMPPKGPSFLFYIVEWSKLILEEESQQAVLDKHCSVQDCKHYIWLEIGAMGESCFTGESQADRWTFFLVSDSNGIWTPPSEGLWQRCLWQSSLREVFSSLRDVLQ